MKMLMFSVEKAYIEKCTECCSVRIFLQNAIVTYYKIAANWYRYDFNIQLTNFNEYF